jgi:hypothetical protein
MFEKGTPAMPTEPRIVTASWYDVLPPETVRIGISRGPPRGQRGYRMLRCLAPGPWYRTSSIVEYVERYAAQLRDLDPAAVYQRITALSEGAELVALLCFERAGEGQWCHRSLVGLWLWTRLGQATPEFGFEALPAHGHSLLPAF